MAIHEESCIVCLEKMQTRRGSEHSGMSPVNESCTAIVGLPFQCLNEQEKYVDEFGELCMSSMLRDSFRDLILAPNSKSTERLPDRRAEGLAATAFVC